MEGGHNAFIHGVVDGSDLIKSLVMDGRSRSRAFASPVVTRPLRGHTNHSLIGCFEDV